MEKVTLTPKTTTVGGLKGPNREHRPVSFEGEEVVFIDPSSHDDNAGTTWEAWETGEGKIVVFVKPWSRWEGTTCTSYVVVYGNRDRFQANDPDLVHPESDYDYGVEVPDFVRAQIEEELGLDSAITV